MGNEYKVFACLHSLVHVGWVFGGIVVLFLGWRIFGNLGNSTGLSQYLEKGEKEKRALVTLRRQGPRKLNFLQYPHWEALNQSNSGLFLAESHSFYIIRRSDVKEKRCYCLHLLLVWDGLLLFSSAFIYLFFFLHNQITLLSLYKQTCFLKCEERSGGHFSE